MRLKAKKPAPPPEAVECEEVESAEESQREIDVNDLQRVLAECEVRIATINEQIDLEVKRRVTNFMASIHDELRAYELSTVSRIAEFFQQSSLWEVERINKTKQQPGEQFYNPHELFRRKCAQGWRWVGQFFDEKQMERYDLFIRPKDLPKHLGDLEKMYLDFRDAKEKQSTAQSAPSKSAKKVVVKLASKTKQG